MINSVPKVSIGMPVYNGEPFIREAIDSLLAQTFTDFELIISDNASTDGTESICREYAERDQRIRYVRQTENKGGTFNFQFVLDEAIGEYFMWAAHDDSWCNKYTEINVRFLNENMDYISSTTNVLDGFDEDVYPIMERDSGRKRVEGIVGRHGSNHMFYSLHRRIELVHNVNSFVMCRANDWVFLLYVLSSKKMKVHAEFKCFNKRIQKQTGNSVIPKIWSEMKDSKINYFIPFFVYSKTALMLSPTVKTFGSILTLNIRTFLVQIRKMLRNLLALR